MVNVIGLGYIGLPTALMLASSGAQVVGTDYNKKLIASLQKGVLTFEEEGADPLLKKAIASGIVFSTDYIAADIYIIAVPTPYDSVSKRIDVSYVENAVKQAIKVCRQEAVIIIESTVSPGTIDKCVRPLLPADKKIHLAHAPERIIPGNMIYELVNNNRTIGVDDAHTGEKVQRLYSLFCRGEIVVTDIRTAEMSKVVENTYRDINIALANELTQICRAAGMDVYEVIRIANKHPRVNILQPGPGVGGHCISVDPWFLVGDFPELTEVILAARKRNDSMPEFVLSRLSEIMEEIGLTDMSRVGLYGLSYKENVDDIRESPTLQILERLQAASPQVYDPHVKKSAVPNQHRTLNGFLESVDLVVVLVAHNEIKEKMELLRGKVIFDTKNIIPFDGTYKL